MLTFDEPTHTYRYNGVLVPSVTTILKPLYSFDGIPPEVLERKRWIGQAVHRATELIDRGTLDPDTVAPEIAGYLVAYREFLAAVKPDWMFIEHRVYSKDFRFAGTYDRQGELHRHAAMVDIKTGPPDPAIGVQLAAYEKAEPTHHLRRYALHLGPDGRYQLIEHTDRNDWPTFLSCLNLHNWKARHA